MSVAPDAMPPFEQQVADLRGYLLKFARLQLRNETWAEDAVSDTVLAALSKPQSFGNRSQLKTWLVGILKHKVVDALRHHSREVGGLQTDADSDADPLDFIAFRADGHFAETPADWGNPRPRPTAASSLPSWRPAPTSCRATQGRLFLMREWLELCHATRSVRNWA